MNRLILTILAGGCLCVSCARRSDDSYEIMDRSYVHRYGVPVEPSDWMARGETGKVVTTLKSGVIVSKSYSNGILDGETTYTYPHCECLEKVETYSQGQLVKEESYYRNGTPSKQVTHSADTESQVYGWYDNGAPQKSESYQKDLLVKGEYYDLNHQMDSQVENFKGLRTKRDPFGHLIGVDSIEEGSVLLTKIFYPNGSIKQITPYLNGQIEGQVKTYLPGGEPLSIETWTGGEKTGIATMFENGEKIAEVPYRRGLKEGIEVRFRNGNTPTQEISWVGDVRHGPSRITIGEITTIDYYFQGKGVSRSCF